MAERPTTDTPFERVDPDEVSGQNFTVARKGFDQKQVQAYLVSVGNQIKAGQQQIRDLREQVAQADAEPEPEAEFSPQGVKLLDDGVEASRRQTQTEASEIAGRARRLAEELEKTVEDLQSQQEVAGTEKVAELLEQACEQAQSVAGLVQEAREQAEAEVEQGRAQGREIVEQAKTLRLKVLRDMARRRQTARAQVERLRAGRDRLMAVLGEARQSIELSMESAKMSLAEAKVVADAAARRVEDESGPTDIALLSELDDARTLGLVSDADMAPEGQAQQESADTPAVEMALDPGTDHEGVALLSPANSDPAPATPDHPVLAGARDSHDMDAIFARLRTKDGQPQADAETVLDAAGTSVGEE